MKASWIRLVSLALQVFPRRHQNQKLLREINATYDESAREEDLGLVRRMRGHHRRVIEAEVQAEGT